MAQPEEETKKAVKKVLKELSPLVYQIMPATGYGGSVGIPDHVACMPVTITPEMVGKTFGAFIGVESKTPTGKLHGLQSINISWIIAAGGFAQVVYSEEGAQVLKQQLIKRYQL